MKTRLIQTARAMAVSCIRLVRVLWAIVRCEGYLLIGMWRGECMLTGYGKDGRIALVASVTGSIFDNTLVIHRVFYGKAP